MSWPLEIHVLILEFSAVKAQRWMIFIEIYGHIVNEYWKVSMYKRDESNNCQSRITLLVQSAGMGTLGFVDFSWDALMLPKIHGDHEETKEPC